MLTCWSLKTWFCRTKTTLFASMEENLRKLEKLQALLDTNIFVALSNRRDKDHVRAKVLLNRLRKGEFGTPFTSDYVFDEAVTVALFRTGRPDLAIKVGKLILGAPEEENPKLFMLVQVDGRNFSGAWEAFKRHKDRLLSFTDHTSLQIMKSSDYFFAYFRFLNIWMLQIILIMCSCVLCNDSFRL